MRFARTGALAGTALSFMMQTGHPAEAQNLVPNGDFEQYSGCPTALEQLDSALYWYNPTDTGTTLPGTPDYLNQCATATQAFVPATFIGYQPARSGAGYAGLALYHETVAEYREYLAVELIAPLVAGACYQIDLYVNLGNGSRYTTGGLQAYLSDTLIEGIGNYYPMPFTPQLLLTATANFDTVSWKKLSASFVAAGGESCLLIGNFLADSATAVTLANPSGFGPFVYCFVEDVSLSPCVGIAEVSSAPAMTVFPNPAHGWFALSPSHARVTRLEVVNPLGEPVLTAVDPDTDYIPAGGIRPGLYVVRVFTKDGIRQCRLVIE